MKFGKTLLSELYQPWAAFYINYTQLKRKLKELVNKDKAQGLPDKFLELLEKELRKIDEFYVKEEAILSEEVVRFENVSNVKSKTLKKDLCEVYIQCKILVEFCCLNYTGFAKILKKFVKMSDFDEEARSAQAKFMEVVKDSSFNSSKKVEGLLETLKEAYANTFELGNRKLAFVALESAWSSDARSQPRNVKDALLLKKAFIIDMDGVIYHGEHLLPGATEFVEWLKREQKKFLFLTNSSDKSPKELKNKLERLGISLSEQNFMTSALATANFLASQKPHGSAYVIGEAGLHLALYDVGYTMNDVDPDYVVVGETRNYNYQSLEKAVNLVRRGAKLIGTHHDLVDKSVTGLAPVGGALIAPIELASGKKAYFLGKPNPLIMRAALRKLGARAEDAVIIGDRMDTDIIAGIESDIVTVLVLSGVTDEEELSKFPFRPTYVLNGVGDVVNM